MAIETRTGTRSGRRRGRLAATTAAVFGLAVGATVLYAAPRRRHVLPAPAKGGVVVGLCDGETSVEVTDARPGQALPKERAQAVSDDLMRAWRARHPEAHWDQALAENTPPTATTPAPAPATAPGKAAAPGGMARGPAGQGNAGAPTVAVPAAQQGGTYESFTPRDEIVWAEETRKFIEEGSGIFHDGKKLGGTIGVSCDMCHPNGANTHPETYPKYQVQLQRVALLRDMIDWCIENPVKGKPFADDDRRLRALEAYLYAQRKGTKLEYGRH